MVNQSYLMLVTENFQSIKKLADSAMEQLNIDELTYTPNEESNSISVLVRHMSGNLKSRFSDFLTSDGEKPDRNRDGEFVGSYESKHQLIEAWNSGWEVLFNSLSGLKEEDLNKTVLIRNEPHSVMEAIQRQIVHQSSHSGQIVYIAKMIKDKEWTTLSIPRGKSETFNQQMNEQFK